MPKRNEIDVLKEMRANKDEIPVIFCSSHLPPEVLNEAEELGIADYLEKPVKPQTLRETAFGIQSPKNLNITPK